MELTFDDKALTCYLIVCISKVIDGNSAKVYIKNNSLDQIINPLMILNSLIFQQYRIRSLCPNMLKICGLLFASLR